MNSSAADARTEHASQVSRNLETLRQVSLFSGLDLEPLKLLAYLGRLEVFRPGDDLFRENDQDGRAFAILEGRVEVRREGFEEPFAAFGPGHFLGGLSLLADTRRLFTLRAGERVECLVLTRERFLKTLERYPEMLPKVLDATVRAVRDWEDRFVRSHAAACEVCRNGLGVSLV